MTNKHIKTFIDFVNESQVNEGKEWFPGSTIDNFIGDGSPKWKDFWKNAKKGDNFMSSPNGVDLLSCAKSELSKSKIEVETTYYGATGGGGQMAMCMIVDRKKVNLVGADDYDEDDKIDTIFYTIDGKNDPVYLLPDM